MRWSLRRKRRVSGLIDPGELPVVALKVSGDRLHSRDTGGAWRVWNLRTREREDVRPSPRRKLFGKLPPIDGESVGWVRKNPRRRLIDIENRFGLKLDSTKRVVPVPLDEYDPKRPRIHPWSR